MEIFLTVIGVGLLAIMLMPLYRLVRGPTSFDRVMGVNVIGTKTTVLIVIIGAVYGRMDMFVDIALAYALLNFIATLGVARFFQHRRRVEELQASAAGAAGSDTEGGTGSEPAGSENRGREGGAP